MLMGRAVNGWDLFQSSDPRITTEGEVVGATAGLTAAEAEELEAIGYQGQWVGGVFFVTHFVRPVTDGLEVGLEVVEEKPEHDGRRRTAAELEKAATAEHRGREAARKRAARKRGCGA